LLAPTAAGLVDATLFTTPAATVTIVRHIRVCNTAALAATFSIAFGGSTAVAANCIAGTQSVPANSSVDLYGYYVLPAATAVHGVASAVTVTFEASGDLSVAGG
jgi:cellulase/cellobiase CelA1